MAGPAVMSSVQLQAHYDEVMSQMPVLPLSILPRPLASSLSTHNLDAAAVKLAKKVSAGLTECQVCSCSSQPDQLQLLLSTKLEFHTRAVHATAARFVCSQCAAVSCCSTVIQLLTPPIGADADEQRSEQLHQLLLHFAAVNNAPASITSNPDSLALWVQELSCRAYSLAVVANSLKGWTLQPAGASTLQVLQQLLRPAKSKTAAAQPQADAAVAGAGQHKKKLKSKQGSQQAQQQQAGKQKASGAGSKRLSSGHAAAAETLAAHSKKQKKSSAHVADSSAGQQTPSAQQQQQQPRSVKKQKLTTPAAGSAAAAVTPKGKKAAPGGKQAAGADAALRTPQHSKIKSSSSKKHKLLKSAPR